MAECGGGLLRQAHPQTPEIRRLSLGRRSAGGNQPLHRRAQRGRAAHFGLPVGARLRAGSSPFDQFALCRLWTNLEGNSNADDDPTQKIDPRCSYCNPMVSRPRVLLEFKRIQRPENLGNVPTIVRLGTFHRPSAHHHQCKWSAYDPVCGRSLEWGQRN